MKKDVEETEKYSVASLCFREVMTKLQAMTLIKKNFPPAAGCVIAKTKKKSYRKTIVFGLKQRS